MLYLTNNRCTNKDELQLKKLLLKKQVIKDYYKSFPNTNTYFRILYLNSIISCCKRKLSRNVTK